MYGSDRRRVGLALTEQGHAVLRSVKNRRTALLAERLKKLSDEDVARLDDAIAALEKLL